MKMFIRIPNQCILGRPLYIRCEEEEHKGEHNDIAKMASQGLDQLWENFVGILPRRLKICPR